MGRENVANMKVSGSFRDPSGFVFHRRGSIYRQINQSYKDNYDHLINSGLYERLVDSELLVLHEEVNTDNVVSDNAYKVIKPEPIPFVSYPYEWCFSQLKLAALTTLNIQKIALHHEMILKDSSAYNIQFKKSRPILIDSLSFNKYQPGQPWFAYKQFCEHFMGPLALMSYKDIRLNQLLRIYIDGIPLDLASKILPIQTLFRPSILIHIHIHSKCQNYFAGKTVKRNRRNISRTSLFGLVDNLESAIKKLNWKPIKTEWSGYYEDNNYSPESFQNKQELVSLLMDKITSKTVWDLGANVGIFSRIASRRGIQTICFDIDPCAVEKNYLKCIRDQENNILPLVLDLTNPSPSIGWENKERMTVWERGPADVILALALIHHMAISNNLPFTKIASLLSNICKWLIIEFIPKTDLQVQRLLSTRHDIFGSYRRTIFEKTFMHYFTIEQCEKIKCSERTLYLMRRRS